MTTEPQWAGQAKLTTVREYVAAEMLNAAMASALEMERSLQAAARHLAAAEALQLAADEKASRWVGAVDAANGGKA